MTEEGTPKASMRGDLLSALNRAKGVISEAIHSAPESEHALALIQKDAEALNANTTRAAERLDSILRMRVQRMSSGGLFQSEEGKTFWETNVKVPSIFCAGLCALLSRHYSLRAPLHTVCEHFKAIVPICAESGIVADIDFDDFCTTTGLAVAKSEFGPKYQLMLHDFLLSGKTLSLPLHGGALSRTSGVPSSARESTSKDSARSQTQTLPPRPNSARPPSAGGAPSTPLDSSRSRTSDRSKSPFQRGAPQPPTSARSRDQTPTKQISTTSRPSSASRSRPGSASPTPRTARSECGSDEFFLGNALSSLERSRMNKHIPNKFFDDREKMYDELQAVKKRLTEVIEENKKANTKCLRLEAENKKLEQKLEDYLNVKATASADSIMKDKLNTDATVIKTLRARVKDLESLVQKQTEELSVYQNESVQENVKMLEGELAQSVAEVKRLERLIGEHQGQQAEFSTKLMEKDAIIENSRYKMARYKSENSKLKTELETLQIRYDREREVKEFLVQKKDDLEKKLKEAMTTKVQESEIIDYFKGVEADLRKRYENLLEDHTKGLETTESLRVELQKYKAAYEKERNARRQLQQQMQQSGGGDVKPKKPETPAEQSKSMGTIKLQFSADQLPCMDWFGKSDCYLKLVRIADSSCMWTSPVASANAPEWGYSVPLSVFDLCLGNMETPFMLELWDKDDTTDEFVGKTQTSLAELVKLSSKKAAGGSGKQKFLSLQNQHRSPDAPCGRIFVQVDTSSRNGPSPPSITKPQPPPRPSQPSQPKVPTTPITQQQEETETAEDSFEFEDQGPLPTLSADAIIRLMVAATELPVHDMTGSSDPYVKILFGGELVWKSNTVKRCLNPVFDECETNAEKLCKAQWNAPLTIEVWDWDRVSKDDMMGTVTTTFEKLYRMSEANQNLTASDRLFLQLKGGKKDPNAPKGKLFISVELQLPSSQEDQEGDFESDSPVHRTVSFGQEEGLISTPGVDQFVENLISPQPAPRKVEVEKVEREEEYGVEEFDEEEVEEEGPVSVPVHPLEQTLQNDGFVSLIVHARNLDKMDVIGSSDPFVNLSVMGPGDSQPTFVLKTEIIMKNLNPDFKPLKMKLKDLCKGHLDCTVVFHFFDYDSVTSNDEIGIAQATLLELWDMHIANQSVAGDQKDSIEIFRKKKKTSAGRVWVDFELS